MPVMESKIKSKKVFGLDICSHLRDVFISSYTLNNSHLSTSDIYKDLSFLIITNNLQFSSHCYHIVHKAHSGCKLILCAFPSSNVKTIT